MHNAIWFVLFILQYPSRCQSQTSNSNLPNLIGSSEFLDRSDSVFKTHKYSWAKGNQSCAQLLEESQSYLKTLPPLSDLFVRPAIGMGLIQVGCLSKTDNFYLDIIENEHVRDMFRLLSEQWKMLSHPTSQYLSNKKHKLDIEALRFNLDSLSPFPLFRNVSHCSGFRQERKGVLLKGFDLGNHSSLQKARIYCDLLGPSCAGVLLDNSGQFYAVAMSGSYIIPQIGSSVWFHHCPVAHVRRRSTTSECQNEQEERIYNVMQWVPVVSGWYNAGSAIYYASNGCGVQAEDRAIEASLDLGTDALLAATGGSSSVVGIAVRPALKAGVKAAIQYFKQKPVPDQLSR
ncbi:Hypothetical predicted protein [Pelobates cultripes]|uniref:Apolipoprotein F n=1 Tax=Pelobates cultripes TaxID=61616 RepID=A0AAD1R5G7_PELCU|nr:Hypothetical predicted protein [Pelobates cultripes]